MKFDFTFTGPIALQCLISAITIWMTLLAGNKNPKAWLFGLWNQLLWLAMIIWTGAWGLIPLNMAMWVLYARNHLKWNKKLEPKPVRFLYRFNFRIDFPEIPDPYGTYLVTTTNEVYEVVDGKYVMMPTISPGDGQIFRFNDVEDFPRNGQHGAIYVTNSGKAFVWFDNNYHAVADKDQQFPAAQGAAS